MALALLSIATEARGGARSAFELDGYLAGGHYAEARSYPHSSGIIYRVAAEPTHRQVVRAARAALVDYSIDRPSLHLCLDDVRTTSAWLTAFADGCCDRFHAWRERRLAG